MTVLAVWLVLITLAMQAASQFVDYMHTGDKVGVVSFAPASTDYPLTTIVDDNTKSAAKTINQ